MSFSLPSNIVIASIERRTVEIMVNGHGQRGDDFTSMTFVRESVFLDGSGQEVKRTRDPEGFEFTPSTMAQAPELAQAVQTIYQYLDGADQMRLAAEQPQ
jgi:hypothetical protein